MADTIWITSTRDPDGKPVCEHPLAGAQAAAKVAAAVLGAYDRGHLEIPAAYLADTLRLTARACEGYSTVIARVRECAQQWVDQADPPDRNDGKRQRADARADVGLSILNILGES